MVGSVELNQTNEQCETEEVKSKARLLCASELGRWAQAGKLSHSSCRRKKARRRK